MLYENTGVNASESTIICQTLKRFGFSIQHVALQRSDVLIGEYQAKLSMYNSSSFIFVDETGCDRRDAIRRYGYSVRGYPAKSARILCRGTRYSAIGKTSTTSLLDCYITEGTVDEDAFYKFVQTSLLSQLREFNGISPNSLVIMDNCSIHHVQKVIDLFQCWCISNLLAALQSTFNAN